jgi:hypothetical protein
MTIEQFLSAHFLDRTTDKYVTEDRGKRLTPQEAERICQALTPRQRAAVDPDTIASLHELLVEDAKAGGKKFIRDVKKLKSFAWFKARRSPELERSWVTLAVLHHLVDTDDALGSFSIESNRYARACLDGIRDVLGKRTLKLDVAQVWAALDSSVRPPDDDASDRPSFDYGLTDPPMAALKRVHEAGERIELTDGDAAMLRDFRAQLVEDGFGKDSRVQSNLIEELLRRRQGVGKQTATNANTAAAAAADDDDEPDTLWPGEPWAVVVNAAIRSLGAPRRAAATKLLKHAGSCNEYTAKPGKAWFASAQAIIDDFGQQPAREAVGGWLRAFADDDRKELAAFEERWHNRHFDKRAVDGAKFRQNTGYMAGVAHVARCFPGPQLLPVLADVVERVARAKPMVREQSATVATAALRSIEASDDPLAAACLTRLALRLRWPKLRKAADKALKQYVERKGVSRQELEETTVPDFGLRDGKATIALGDGWTAEIDATNSYEPKVTWRKPDGAVARSCAVIKKSHPDEVEAAQRTLKDIEAMLPAQRTRLELLLRDTRTWRLDAWRQRYLDHGLLSPMVRRLIWTVDATPVVFVDDVARDVNGKTIDFAGSAEVSAWHPVGRPVEEVVAWRQRLEAIGVSQPFKQAHREVYLVTGAELATRTYSNRFAAHIVKTPTFIAIGQTRKWTVSLYGEAKLDLPQFDLRAEYWAHEAAEAGGGGREHLAHSYGPAYLATDQVRFYRAGETEPMPVADVPPLAFSEVMRDCDLFVGIASVGADPNWTDGGHGERYRDYWMSYSFGDLTESAKTRKAVLERLIPRLKIAPRCELTDKFLRVRGDIRRYKVHLGSGNILMEPNDQYLCIVPARGGAVPAGGARSGGGGADGKVFLPFEGDTTLSVILSKAFLLADDANITDPTITGQIGRRFR